MEIGALATSCGGQARLREIGFDFYFLTQFGQTVFPRAPAQGSWVLMGDAVPGKSVDSENSLDPVPHRMRFPFGDGHSVLRRTTIVRPIAKNRPFAGQPSEADTA